MANKRQAKKSRSKAAKNKTLQDLYNVDISKLNSKTIRDYFKVARENVRKSVKQWEKREYKSPAYYALAKQTDGAKVSFAGKSLKQQKQMLAQARRFLNDESRTVKGWEKIKEDNIEVLNKKYNIDLTPEEYDRFYSAYEKAKQLNKNVERMEYKYNLMETLLDEMRDNPTMSKDELAVMISAQAPKEGERVEKTHQENLGDYSSPFKKR